MVRRAQFLSGEGDSECQASPRGAAGSPPVLNLGETRKERAPSGHTKMEYI